MQLSKPKFSGMNQLDPDARYNVTVRVAEYETLSRRKRIDGSIVEVGQALVGDRQGCALLILRGEQVENFAKPGMTLTLRNAHTRVDRTGHIKLNVDIWGKIEEATNPIKGEINLANNISKAEYEAIFNDGDRRGGQGAPTRGGPDERGGYSDRPPKKRYYN